MLTWSTKHWFQPFKVIIWFKIPFATTTKSKQQFLELIISIYTFTFSMSEFVWLLHNLGLKIHNYLFNTHLFLVDMFKLFHDINWAKSTILLITDNSSHSFTLKRISYCARQFKTNMNGGTGVPDSIWRTKNLDGWTCTWRFNI